MLRRIGALGAFRKWRKKAMQFAGSTSHWPFMSLLPEILPLLIARKIVVLLRPVAAAAAARVYGIVMRPVALSGVCNVATQWLIMP